MSEWAPRRFWKEATVAEAEGGYDVLLDGRPVRTPGKAPLRLPTRGLALKVADEWNAQGEHLDPRSMPATRAANTAIDRLGQEREAVADMLAAYADADLLCYRADTPEELVARQAQVWDPLLDWAAERHGARLEPRRGVMHAPQDPQALARLAAPVHALPVFELGAFHDLVTISGSLVLALAVAEGRLDAETGWQLSRIDETWQEELWGRDEEAAEHAELRRQSFLLAAHLFDLARTDR